MFSKPNPRLAGKGNRNLSQVFGIEAGTDIAITNAGNGVYRISYDSPAPALASVTQDFINYSTASSALIAGYSHGKAPAADNGTFTYKISGYADSIGQKIKVQIDSQDCGEFDTISAGNFTFEMVATIRDVASDDVDVTTTFSGCGVTNNVKGFTAAQGNQITLSYGGSKTIDIYFVSGAGTVYTYAFNASYKPPGSL